MFLSFSKGGPTFSPSHPLLPLRQRQQKQQGEDGASKKNSLYNLESQQKRQGCVQQLFLYTHSLLVCVWLGLRNRSNSLTQMDGQPRGSVVAWPDKRQR